MLAECAHRLLLVPSAKLQGSWPFSKEEEAQLSQMLALSSSDLAVLLEGSAYVFETAAFHGLKGPAFTAALAEAELPAAQAGVYGSVWASESASVTSRLRGRHLGAPLLLHSTAWRLHLGMGSSGETGVKHTTAVFDLALGLPEAPAASAAAARGEGSLLASSSSSGGGSGSSSAAPGPSAVVHSPVTELLSLEFTKPQLLELLAQLDTIQQQVDALS